MWCWSDNVNNRNFFRRIKRDCGSRLGCCRMSCTLSCGRGLWFRCRFDWFLCSCYWFGGDWGSRLFTHECIFIRTRMIIPYESFKLGIWFDFLISSKYPTSKITFIPNSSTKLILFKIVRFTFSPVFVIERRTIDPSGLFVIFCIQTNPILSIQRLSFVIAGMHRICFCEQLYKIRWKLLELLPDKIPVTKSCSALLWMETKFDLAFLQASRAFTHGILPKGL